MLEEKTACIPDCSRSSSFHVDYFQPRSLPPSYTHMYTYAHTEREREQGVQSGMWSNTVICAIWREGVYVAADRLTKIA